MRPQVKEEIAQRLLEAKYLLTALEFHQELLEEGEDLPILNKFFSNPANLEKESLGILTPSSTGTGRPEDAVVPSPNVTTAVTHDPNSVVLSIQELEAFKEKEEKLALLEYELRMAREDVNTLKKELAGSLNKARSQANENKQVEQLPSEIETAEVKPFEVRFVNYLLKQYLVARDYKVTAMTFASEVLDQDLDSFADVGVDDETSEPPDLITFYRYFYNAGPNKKLHDLEKNVLSLKRENEQLQQKVKEREQRFLNAQKQADELAYDKECLEIEIDKIRKHLASAKENIDVLQTEAARLEKYNVPSAAPLTTPTPASAGSSTAQQPKTSNEPAPSETKAEEIVASSSTESTPKEDSRTDLMQRWREKGYVFFASKTKKRTEENTRIVSEIEKIVTLERDNQSVVRIIADCLPNIVPGVLLNKREELLPVFLCIVRQHPNPNIRDDLTRLLFNLIKKPNDEQRRMIMDGCVALASLVGAERTEVELLPQCWEQITDKHEERRVLVAESCGALAPFVKTDLRPSLILSILVQLLDDRSGLVREAVARNLAYLTSLFSSFDKFAKVEELVLRLLYDSDPTVQVTTRTMLIPVFSDWANARDKDCQKILTIWMEEIGRVLKAITEAAGKAVDSQTRRLDVLFESLKQILPRIWHAILLLSPLPLPEALSEIKPEEVALLTPQQEEFLAGQFNKLVEQNQVASEETGANWPAAKALCTTFSSHLVKLLSKVDVSNSPQVLHGLSNLLLVVCKTFGATYTNLVLKPLLLEEMELNETKSLSKEAQTKRTRLLPYYLNAILLSHDQNDALMNIVRDLICKIALEESGWTSAQLAPLRDSVSFVCSKSADYKAAVLNLLRDLVVHPSVQVRANILQIFNMLVNVLAPYEISVRLLPALITLSNDVDKLVRLYSIKPLASVAAAVSDEILLEKINAQFELILDDPTHSLVLEIIKAFTMLIPTVKARFRDNCILPKLYLLAEKNGENSVTNQRSDVGKALFEAFRAFNGCHIGEEAINRYIIPGLRLLNNEGDYMEPAHKSMITSMIRDMEAAVAESTTDQNGNLLTRNPTWRGIFNQAQQMLAKNP